MGTYLEKKMATGIAVDDACVEAFQELKIGHKHRFLIFKINDDHTAVEPLLKGEKDATWDDFVGQAPCGRVPVLHLRFRVHQRRRWTAEQDHLCCVDPLMSAESRRRCCTPVPRT